MSPERSLKVRWPGRVLLLAGVAMIPWLYLLATHLPTTKTASNWSVAWVGLDSLETLGLLATGSLLVRGNDRHRLVAAATATLFITDAWFDITTATSGFERGVAVAIAAGAELPLAILCWSLALRSSSRLRPYLEGDDQ